MEPDKCRFGVCYGVERGGDPRRGFSLIELLVVVAVISILMAIAMPVVNRAGRTVRSAVGANNQREVVSGVTFYALDRQGRFPESVATVGFGAAWNWSEPTKLIGNEERTVGSHRAMSEYLGDYIKDTKTMFCPSAPRKYKYLQQSWEAGDDWDNPETPFPTDPVGGTYCFYWNYIGFLEERDRPFRGPRTMADNGRYSQLLVSDYLGYDHWRRPGAFASCEKLKASAIIPETWLLSAFWSCEGDGEDMTAIGVSLHAGYTDGHVERFDLSDVAPMRVSLNADGSVPWPDGVGPGTFYVPGNSLR
ncbi:MAG: type II secretion system protein [Planctomycetota bacterium]|jgi:prepilin-type N-terminal cleavage/methylation domain-containing protein